MNNTVFIFVFAAMFMYYIINKKYDFALIIFLLLFGAFFFDNSNEHFTEELQMTPENNTILTNFLNGHLTVDYLHINNDANICGVNISNGTVNCPNDAIFMTQYGPLAFINGGSIYANEIFVQ